MPIAKVQMPDGRIARFEVPDGTTEAQVIAFAQSMPATGPEPQNFMQQAQAAGEAQGGDFLGGLQERSAAARSATGRGLLDVGQGIKQGAMTIGEKLGFVDPGAAQDYTRQVEAERAAYEQQPYAQEPRSQVSRFLGQAAPAVAVPGGIAGGIGARLATGAAAGGGIGAAQFVPEGDSRLQNAMIGGALGGATPLAGQGARWAGRQAADFIRPLMPGGGVSSNKAASLVGDELTGAAERRLSDANLLGVQLTPAEATGSNIIARAQGRVGRSDAGSEMLAEAGQARLGQEQGAISDLITGIEPTGRSGAAGVRAAASESLKAKKKILADKARPLYKAARSELISDVQLAALAEDPVVATAIERVLNKPAFQKELKGLPRNSVGFMDVVKRELWDQVSTLERAGSSGEAGIVRESWGSVRSALKESSDNYSAAVALYAPEARTLQQLKEGALGRISGLKEGQLKSVSKVVFDPQQTNVKELRGLRDLIYKEDPGSWNRIVRNEIDRRLDMVKGERTGSSFYSEILSRERDFKMFDNALAKDPVSRRKLRAMKNAFKDLINLDTAKGAAGRAQANLDAPRSATQWAVDKARGIAGGRHDKAAAKFLTSPDWDDQFRVIMRTAKTKDAKARRLAGLLGRISAQQATAPPPEL